MQTKDAIGCVDQGEIIEPNECQFPIDATR